MLTARVRKELRSIDQFARYGGEEFTVILPGTPKASLKDVAERLREAIAGKPFRIDENAIFITISIGGVTSPEDATDVRGLVQAADHALYRAKAGGRNTVSVTGMPTSPNPE